jgi:hypothetical protein
MNDISAPVSGFSHDRMDAIIAAIASYCGRLFGRPDRDADADEIAFSDQWERAHIERDLHLN